MLCFITLCHWAEAEKQKNLCPMLKAQKWHIWSYWSGSTATVSLWAWRTLILPVEVCKGLEWFEGKHKMDHRWDENGCIAALFISLPYLAGGWRLLLTPWFIEKISFLLISQGRSGSRTILLFGFLCEKNWFLKSYKPRYTVRFAAYHFICKIYITAWRLSGHKACKPTPKSNI